MPWGYFIPGPFGGLARDVGLVYEYMKTPEHAVTEDERIQCPAASQWDCQVGETNMTKESFACRNCIRGNGHGVFVDLQELPTVVNKALTSRAKCLAS